MEVFFIGNYPQDKQESMERYTQMLVHGFREAGHQAQIWRPKVILGSWFSSTNHGVGKWFGYIDKWVIFPLILRWRLKFQLSGRNDIRFHICDHSNSPYLQHLPNERTCITCHDVIAIRGGVGFADDYNRASGLGKILQRWILGNLKKAKKIAAVSHYTLNQLNELVPAPEREYTNWKVIYNAFNADFKPKETKEAFLLLEQAGIDLKVPFILHVGSNLLRKNRKMVLSMVASLGNRWKGQIIFAGKEADEAIMAQAKILGLQDRIISIVKPDHATLEALYSTCEAFVFPSFCEGFGWPIIEAQACGAPVIASNQGPLPEISGGAALHADPTQPDDFSEMFLALQNQAVKADLIKRGFINCGRFDFVKILDDYLELHDLERQNVELCF